MPEKQGKLVRDKVPALMRSQGLDPDVRFVHGEELEEYLRRKVVEEAGEIVLAKKVSELSEEIADLLEVVDALMKARGITHSRIAAVREWKRARRGAFAQGAILFNE